MAAATPKPSRGLVATINSQLRPFGIVLYSTPASVRARWPSVLAFFEIAAAMAAYWWIAIRYDTQKHLWISICVAPLLLLRSKASIARGVRWITAYAEEGDTLENLTVAETLRTWRFWAIVTAALVGCTMFSHWLASQWLFGHDGWALFWRAAVLGWLALNVGMAIGIALTNAGAATRISMAATVVATSRVAARDRARAALATIAGAEPDAGTATKVGATAVMATLAASAALSLTAVAFAVGGILAAAGILTAAAILLALAVLAAAGVFGVTAVLATGLVLFFGLILGYSVRVLCTRFVATLLHPWEGWKALPANWTTTLFVIDLVHPPEMVPSYTGTTIFNFEYFNRVIRSRLRFDSEKMASSAVIYVVYAPAYFYRLSIKSTFWLYWPLAYLANDARAKGRPAVLFDRLAATPLAWLSILTAGVTFATFLTQNFFVHVAALWPAVRVSLPLAAVEFLFQFDWASQKPWLWFSLTSATITLSLFFWAGEMRPELKHGEIDNWTEAKIQHHALWMKRLARLRRICTILLILSLLAYFLLWRSPLQCVVHEYGLDHIHALFHWYYGSHMPQGPACS
jgi:hypothetical protein